MTDLGVTLNKAAVRQILEWLVGHNGDREYFSDGPLGIEQATNRIMRLQRPPADLFAAALTVDCPHCGYTPGNPCRWGDRVERNPHPSRIAKIIAASQDVRP